MKRRIQLDNHLELQRLAKSNKKELKGSHNMMLSNKLKKNNPQLTREGNLMLGKASRNHSQKKCLQLNRTHIMTTLMSMKMMVLRRLNNLLHKSLRETKEEIVMTRMKVLRRKNLLRSLRNLLNWAIMLL